MGGKQDASIRVLAKFDLPVRRIRVLYGRRDKIGIAPHQIPPQDKDQTLGSADGRAPEGKVPAERHVKREAMNLLGEFVRVSIPEPAKVGAALVCGVIAPQEFAPEFVGCPDQEAFAETGIDLQQSHEVALWNAAQTGHQPVPVIGIESLIHGAVEHRRGHDRS